MNRTPPANGPQPYDLEQLTVAAASEGQKILGVSTARWFQMVQEPTFPQPIDILSCGAIYDAQALRDLAAQRAAYRAGVRERAGTPRARVPALPADLVLP